MGHPPSVPPGPPPGAPPPPPSSGPGRLVIVLVAVIAVVLVAVGCLGAFVILRDDDGGASAAASAGPVNLRTPLTFRLAASIAAPPCAGGAVTVPGSTECFTLGPDAVEVRRLEEVKALPPDPAQGRTGWAVALTLTSADTPRFAALTRRAADAFAARKPAGRMAMLLGGTLMAEPAQVMEPITRGRVEINGPAATFTRAHVEGVVRRLAGR
ncbi:hypothetical protein GWI34_15090 [Actinomadura sp. DSM 109109]|nr:hypothetical protein [Actinomadura lepetitiana]